jgi:glyoxylate reductase
MRATWISSIARGVAICNTPGVLTEATADQAFTLLMAMARRIPEAIEYVRAGEWKFWHPMAMLGHDINGATLGIVGFGRIGQAVARRARASFDRNPRPLHVVYVVPMHLDPWIEAGFAAERRDHYAILRPGTS